MNDKHRAKNCPMKSSEGERCALYQGHYGPHRSNHLKNSWWDGYLGSEGEMDGNI